MVKVTGPVFSMDAKGTLGDVLTYQGGFGGHRVTRKPDHRDAASEAQQVQRAKFQVAMAAWGVLTEGEKGAYNALADPMKMTGYQYFLKQYLGLAGPGGCSPFGGEVVGTLTPTLEWVHNSLSGRPQSDAEYEIRRNDTGELVTGYPERSAKATDSFSRADSATPGSDESLPAPKAWSWTPPLAWSIVSGELKSTEESDSYCYLNSGVSDCDVVAKVLWAPGLPTPGKRGVVFRRGTSFANLWMVVLVPGAVSGARLWLFKIVDWDWYEQAISADLEAVEGQRYRVKVSLSGDQISVYFEDALVIGPLIDAFQQSGTRHGFYCEAYGTFRFDDFLVSDAASKLESHSVPEGRLSWGVTYKWKVKTRDGYLWGPESGWNVFTCQEP